jgi:hypothetical protein
MYPSDLGVQLTRALSRRAWGVLFLLPWTLLHNFLECL